MATKKYIAEDGKSWTENYDDAGLWPVKVAAYIARGRAEETCLIQDASGQWLVVNYEDPDLAPAEDQVVYVVLIGSRNAIGGLYTTFDVAVEALTKHWADRGLIPRRTSGDSWAVDGPEGAVLYHVLPYAVHTKAE